MNPSPRNATLHGTPVVVIGATGHIGRGVVAALLEAGTPVLAVARDATRLAELRMGTGPDPRLGVIPASLASDAEGEELAAVLRAFRRPLGGVVVCLSGPRQRGRLIEQPADFLERTLNENVTPVLVAARHLVPLLAAAGKGLPFLVIGGPAADVPWAGYGQHSVAAAAQRMLLRVLHDELAGEPVRVQQLVIGSPVCSGRHDEPACPEWPSALDVGHQVCIALADAHSHEAVRRLFPSPRPSATPPTAATNPT
ncbi:SDR family NAD(P)-dependent oxidoreductase [Arenimonas fontis]|uniref:SDR family NAD(P)-dependent oxidoreductase n=1 Tax=Arenimonas fontis TaxID=2608255 RepID=A0A5B2ZAE3_9GAMM|nr:SDR family oxidoreductase [Arenimonas fontis]KAA2284122.1 SDR family NAD(P)-dependent oxidoreductase [Arenimonas fontis]